MAVTITAAELAAQIGVEAVPDGARLLTVATALHDRYVGSGASRVPEAISNEAVICVAGYLHQHPTAGVRSERAGELQTDYAVGHLAALRHSGAMALLSPYKRRRARAGGGPSSTRSTTDDDGDDDGGTTMRVRAFLPPFGPTFGAVQIPTMTAAAVFAVAEAHELQAATARRVSRGAPVYCWAQDFAYTIPTGATLAWAIIAIAQGLPAPSHFRLAEGGPVNPAPGALVDWLPSGRWTQIAGQAVDAGQAYDVWWWPQVRTAAETLTFEWPA